MTETVLVTGANRGIGLEFAAQYAEDGWRVIASCRQPEQASELARLATDGNVKIVQLDVTDGASVSALAAELKGSPLELLINNAGVYGPKGRGLGELDGAAWLEVFATNSIAPLQITGALLANLKAAKRPRVVGISSRMGSIGDNSSGGAYIYRSSKAALNAALASAAIDLREAGIAVGILHPGWVETDMGGSNALIDTATSVAGLRKVIDKLDLKNSGRFFSYDGSSIPW